MKTSHLIAAIALGFCNLSWSEDAGFPSENWFSVRNRGDAFVNAAGGATVTLVHVAPRREIGRQEIPGLADVSQSEAEEKFGKGWNLTFHRVKTDTADAEHVELDRVTFAARFKGDTMRIYPPSGDPIPGGIRKEGNGFHLIVGSEHSDTFRGLLSPAGSIYLVPVLPGQIEYTKRSVGLFFRDTLSFKNATGARSILQELIDAVYANESPSFASLPAAGEQRASIKSAEYIGSCEAAFGVVHVARFLFTRPDVKQGGPARGHTVIAFFDRGPLLHVRWDLDDPLFAIQLDGTKLQHNGEQLLDFAALPETYHVIVDGKPMKVPRWGP
jgi:hypothetical protein